MISQILFIHSSGARHLGCFRLLVIVWLEGARVEYSINFFFLYSFFLRFYYLFLEREEGRKKERERNVNVWLPLTWSPLGTWPTTQTCAPIGSQTSDPLVHSLHSIH